jgi:hypothetical protein
MTNDPSTTSDPKKTQNDYGSSQRRAGQDQSTQSGQNQTQQRSNKDDVSQRRPSQGGTNIENDVDQEDQNEGGRRRAS